MSDNSFDFEATTQTDLVTGKSPWGGHATSPASTPLTESFRTGIAIIGGGITGSLAAEHLTALGHQVTIIDREPAGLGSTAASTAMLQWEIDAPLAELTRYYGFERSADIYRRSLSAVAGLSALVERHALPCHFAARQTLYLAADEVNSATLLEEHGLRQRAGLPGTFLDYTTLRREFGFDREAAIHSEGSAEADPLLMSWSLLNLAVSRGAGLIEASATGFSEEGGRVVIATDGPYVIEADHVVLASGYVMPQFVMPKLHSSASSFALATVPQDPAKLWRDRALVWEASESYHYLRVTADNRIIIGGEDDEIADPDKRDAMLADKVARLWETLGRMWPDIDRRVSHTWCGTFGETSDGLPLIGLVPGTKKIFAAYGYGGNGITFSYMASRMIASMIGGQRQAWFEAFALDRDDPTDKG
ncbi:FAD-dependent oxidoreductase [Neorhizobium sp. BT27B]|uniref:NAD(P)/FAD-dependent oxidoreductase n=1 Tax=Neorhizobium sp. BT27B TaxID=3142625 RepID=UPI003D2B8441